jgi:hypothetical protein
MDKPLAYPINKLPAITGIGRSSLYKFIAAGQLQTRKMGTRTLVLHEDLQEFLKRLPTNGSDPKKEAGS